MPSARALSLAGLLLACCLGPDAMAGWKLLREDDFRTATALDPAWWAVETGFLRNQEEQYYTPANLGFGPGFLRLEARRETVPNAAWRAGARQWRQARPSARYTSASIQTRQAFRYGRFEVVARSPEGAGTWPAIWLLHESPGLYGEIDLYEAVGKHPDTVFAGVHYGREPDTRLHKSASLPVPGLAQGWHTHALEWTPQRITVTVDGRTVLDVDPSVAAVGGVDPLRQPMRLRINLALGGTWGGVIDDTRLPARLDIASVRIWRWDAEGGGKAEAETGAGAGVAGPAVRWGR
jgi:beta-glucanase (GH16 family)